MLYKAITNVFADFRWNMNIMKWEMGTIIKKDKSFRAKNYNIWNNIYLDRLTSKLDLAEKKQSVTLKTKL